MRPRLEADISLKQTQSTGFSLTCTHILNSEITNVLNLEEVITPQSTLLKGAYKNIKLFRIIFLCHYVSRAD